MNQAPADRCGYMWPEDYKIGDEPDRQNCCFREVLPDTDRCAWHAHPADTDEKTIQTLKNAQGSAEVKEQTHGTPWSLVDGAILRRMKVDDGGLILDNIALREANLSEADLGEADLSEADLREVDLKEADLGEANLSGANLREADLSEPNNSRAAYYGNETSGDYIAESDTGDHTKADFTGAYLGWANLSGADLRRFEFSEADLRGSDLSGADLRGAVLTEANLDGADLWKADLSGTDLSKADIREADFSEADLGHADLQKARMEGANLSETRMTGAQLSEANLTNTDFSEAYLSGVDFSEATLIVADLTEAFLNNADFSEANLREAVLSRADLERSEFTSANLTEASLIGADCEFVKFTRANLNRATLENADLTSGVFLETYLYQTRLTGAQISETTQFHEAGDVGDISTMNACRYDSSTQPQDPSEAIEEEAIENTDKTSEEARARRARSTYSRLEALARENGYPELKSEMFIRRQDARQELLFAQGQWLRGRFAQIQQRLFRYGESFSRIVSISVLTIAICWVLYMLTGTMADSKGDIVNPEAISNNPILIYESLLQSVYVFASGNQVLRPTNLIGQGIVVVESIIGPLLVALLIFVLGRRAAR